MEREEDRDPTTTGYMLNLPDGITVTDAVAFLSEPPIPQPLLDAFRQMHEYAMQQLDHADVIVHLTPDAE